MFASRALTALILSASLVALGQPAAAARTRPAACPAADYVLHTTLGRTPIAAADVLTVGADGLVSLEGLCPATGKVRATRKGTRIVAAWQSCDGFGGARVKIKGRTDASCETFTGVFTTNDPGGGKIPVIATKKKGTGLRIGTYNVQFLPGLFSRNGSPCGLGNADGTNDDLHRPPAIAERVIASKYDIIAFNEAFDENAQNLLRDLLRPVYPYYASFIYPGSEFNLEDSGLQIFSRFPFEPLSETGYVDTGDVEASHPGMVAAVSFDPFCDGSDCQAEKGAGFARFRHPETGMIFNVAFSHMQASYFTSEDIDDAKEHIDTRRDQLEYKIEPMLAFSMTDEQLEDEEVFLMGDLNVDGDTDDSDLGYDYADKQNLYEYNTLFDTPGELWTDWMHDLWDFQNDPMAVENKDRGLTNYKVPWTDGEDSGARLDYILRHPSSQDGRAVLCVQHIYKSHNLKYGAPYIESAMGEPGTEAGSCELSDHLGLTADLNLEAPACSPQTAIVKSLAKGGLGTAHGNLQYAGAVQWFRYDEPGTYAFALDSNSDAKEDDDLHFQIYQSTDLSTPNPQYKEQTLPIDHAVGKKYVIPNAPFYVKVFDPDRSFTGLYTLYGRRNGCGRKDDSCTLPVATAGSEIFPDGQAANVDDALWFDLETESVGSASPQTLDFYVDSYATSGGDSLTLELRDENGMAVLKTDNTVEDATYAPGTNMLKVTDTEENAVIRYMVVKRSSPTKEPIAIRAFWNTNLTMLVNAQQAGSGGGPLQLDVAITSDDLGSDDVYMKLIADDAEIYPETFLAFLANDEHTSLNDLPDPIRFTEELHFIFREDDPDGNTDDKFEVTIDPIADPFTRCVLYKKKKVTQTFGSGGKWYIFYNLCKGLDTK